MIRFWRDASIRQRLILQLAAIAAVLSILMLFAVRTVSQQAAQAMQDNILAASATSIADAARVERGEVRLDLPYSALSMLGAISDDRVFYRVALDGEALTGYADLPPGNDFSTQTYLGAEIRIAHIERAVTLSGRPATLTVAVAQTREGLSEITGRITTFALAIGLGFFIVAVLLSILATEGALRPLNRLTASMSRRGPSDLRPVQADTPAEIMPLVGALNNFMDRLRASLARSEDFIAEAAHRVRTPLATVRTQADIALRRVERPENKATLRQVIRAVDESSRSATQLLDHAMVTFRADHLEHEALDLGDLTRETVERLEPLASLKDIGLSLAIAGPAPIAGDRILIQNALRNIMDNAIKYSQPDGEVSVVVANAGDLHSVTIRDQGRGFGDADISALTERFSRGANADDVIGSGLGLTICKEVAEAHGGALSLSENEGGGACVTLSLPSR
ncbi:MAG: sensor histidine kinase [Pseudomonadota bacterium]